MDKHSGIRGALIAAVTDGSPADRAGITAGYRLIRINGNPLTDIIDYKFHSYDARVLLELRGGDGGIILKRIKKPEGAELGLEFETSLIDNEKSCGNRCIFCFIDQLPRGMRQSLYYKDDDTRLSFLQGNYVTLTNLDNRAIERIINMRMSPLRVSVHTMRPELRAYMLGNPKAAAGTQVIRRLAKSGIVLECQIVACPGLNDGGELDFTMRELEKLYPGVESVSVVPVGLTRHRGGLTDITPYDEISAKNTVLQTESFAEKCLEKHGSRIFYCADELYIKARLPLPPDGYYEGYPQLENGVGMMRLFITEFESALANLPPPQVCIPFTVVTGSAAAPFIEKLLYTAREKYDIIRGEVRSVRNLFFGETVDVAGLVTGGDIIRTLENNPPEGRILLPRNMLRHGETVFLDDVSVEDIKRRFKADVRIVEQDGADFLRAVCGE